MRRGGGKPGRIGMGKILDLQVIHLVTGYLKGHSGKVVIPQIFSNYFCNASVQCTFDL